MLRRSVLTMAAGALLALATGVSAQSMSPDQREALNAAERWLVPIDERRYADAYAMASAEFKSTIGRQQWLDGIPNIRKGYGRVATRKGEKLGYVGKPPGPDYPTTGPTEGMKIVILFETAFAGNKKAAEEVTMVFENDGLWRVASYYIR